MDSFTRSTSSTTECQRGVLRCVAPLHVALQATLGRCTLVFVRFFCVATNRSHKKCKLPSGSINMCMDATQSVHIMWDSHSNFMTCPALHGHRCHTTCKTRCEFFATRGGNSSKRAPVNITFLQGGGRLGLCGPLLMTLWKGPTSSACYSRCS